MERVKTNLTYMFPGVGSEYHGMGKELYDRYDIVKQIFHTAKEVVGIDFYDLCFGNDVSKIKINTYAQQSLVCLSYAIYHVFQEETNLIPNTLMGYSLGEYSALACSQIMKYEDALHVVNKRAKIIDAVSKGLNGTMVWVINIGRHMVENIVDELIDQGEKVYISAYEAEEKVSVSGTYESIKVLAEVVESKSGMIIPIKMSGPFHSILMKDAAKELRNELEKITFYPSDVQVLANVNSDFYTDKKDEIINNLSNQLCNPILWYQSLTRSMDGLQNIAVELGPKNVLSYIFKLNFANDFCFSIEHYDDIQKMKQCMQNDRIKYQNIIKKCLGLVVSIPNQCDSDSLYQINVKAEYERLIQFYEGMVENNASKRSIMGELNRTYKILQVKGAGTDIIENRLKSIISDTVLIGV